MTSSRKGARSHRNSASWAWPLALVALTLAGLACSLVDHGLQSLATSPSASAGVSTTGSLKAEATSPISVQLSWDGTTGASKYTVELGFGGLGPMVVAELPASATSYEDFPAPPNTELTYRVRAVTAAGTSDVGTATLTTPEETPHPLVVKVNYEQNTFVIPTMDPNNPNQNPSAYLPPGFDPNNPDMSLLQPGPKTVWKDIGPDGGTLEATSAKGVNYTLTVPAHAVAFTLPFGLTPVESIDGLPLSGGLVGAVRVQPEGIEFDQLLTLEITPSEGATAPPAGKADMGFAVTPDFDGHEFYFVPRLPQASGDLPGAGGGRLARLSTHPAAVGPLGPGIAIRNGQVYGVSRGSDGEIRQTLTKNPASSSQNRTTSKVAAEQEEELAPLPPLVDRELSRIEQQTAAAGSTAEFVQALNDFQAYLDSGKTPGPGVEHVWDEMVLNAKLMFDKQKGECLTRDGFTAAGVAARMAFADEGTFWSDFRDRYVKKHGQKSLDDALDFAKRCKLSLNIESKLAWSLESAGVSLEYDVKVAVKPLVMAYQSDPKSPRYGVYLRGYALVYPSRVEMNVQGCKQVVLNPFPTEFIRIGLRPRFDDSGNLSNFEVVDFGGGGGRAKLTQKCEDSTSSAMLTVPNGGAWGGLFVDARRGKVAFTGFSVSSPPPSSGEIAFKWFPEEGSGSTGVSGATVKEQTKFSLMLGQ